MKGWAELTDAEDKEHFGVYLKHLRNLRGYSILELAKLSSVSPSYISRLERGSRQTPKPEVLKKLAPHLGVSYNQMMVKAGYLNESTDYLTIEDQETKDLFLSLTERKKELLKSVEGLSEKTICQIAKAIQQIKKNSSKKPKGQNPEITTQK